MYSSYECIFLFLQSRDRCLGIEGTDFLYSSFYAKKLEYFSSAHKNDTPLRDTPPAEPYVHRMPDFLTDRQRTPPKLSGMPQSVSIKEAMGALGGKLVTGGVPKPGNKDDPDSDQPEKPKTRLKL